MNNFYGINIELPNEELILPIKIFSDTRTEDLLDVLSNAINNFIESINLINKEKNLNKNNIVVLEKRDYLNKHNKDDKDKNLIKNEKHRILLINFKNNFKNLNMNKKDVMNLIYKRLYPLKIEDGDYELEILKELEKEVDYSYHYITPNNNNFSYNSQLKNNNLDSILNKSHNKSDNKSQNLSQNKSEIENNNKVIEEKKIIYTNLYNQVPIEKNINPEIFPKWFKEFNKLKKYEDFTKYIFSSKFSISRISFCYGERRKYLIEDKNCPAPIYLNKEDLKKLMPHTFEQRYDGLKICEKTGLVFTLDKEIIENQKKALSEALKKLAMSIFSFNKTFKFSLPVRIFEPKSISQRLPNWCGYIEYLKCTDDDMERIKSVIKFFTAGIHRSPSQLKPFNPYLGETFEGNIGDNKYKVYSEHLVHEPPTTFFLIENEEFTFSTKVEQALEVGNSIKASYKGFFIIDFKNNKRVIASFPVLQINGLIYGTKSAQFVNNINIIDITSNYRAQITCGTKKRADNFTGFIIKGKNTKFNEKYDISKSSSFLYCNDKKNEMGVNIHQNEFKHKKDDILCNIHGNLFNNIYFDNEKVWDRKEDIPLEFVSNDDCLPSDSKFREDLIWLYYKNIPIADEWKIKLEERQRVDRRLRSKQYTPEKVLKDL